MYEKVLVPLDGSKLGELALPYAEELARMLNSELVLVGICEPDEKQYLDTHQLYIERMADEIANHLKKARPAVIVRSVGICGRPDEEIINYAEKNGLSLVILVSHGRSGIKPWALGNVASKVLQRISIPILLIRAKAAQPEAHAHGLFNRILVPLDGSAAAEIALPYVRQFTEKLKSEVILLRVVEPGKHVHTVGGLTYVPFNEQLVESMKAEVREYLERVSQSLAGAGGIVRFEVRVGDAASEIIRFADEGSIGLVTISTHGHSGIREWFFGNVARKLMQASNSPILLVRALK